MSKRIKPFSMKHPCNLLYSSKFLQNLENFNEEVNQLLKEKHGFHYVHSQKYLN